VTEQDFSESDLITGDHVGKNRFSVEQILLQNSARAVLSELHWSSSLYLYGKGAQERSSFGVLEPRWIKLLPRKSCF
jgi:hypothetical protein